MVKKRKAGTFERQIEKISFRLTHWVGTPWSIIIHTILFVVSFALVLAGVRFEEILLIVTTAVSLEAIYLALFIQMSVNRQSLRIADLDRDLDEISEDVELLENLQEDVEDLAEDFDRIQQEDLAEDQEEEQRQRKTYQSLQTIEKSLMSVTGAIKELEKDIELLRHHH